MDNETLDVNAARIVEDIGIAPCPAILTQLLRETRAEEPDFRRVGQLIGADVALAASVLAVVNSSFYGLPVKAASVQQALSFLGLNAVTQLVTGLLLRQAFSGLSVPAMEEYWKRSTATSLICALVCKEAGKGDPAIASTYGLFRDCGMPVMLQRYPIYADIFDGSALVPDEPMTDIENERYSTNHARVAAQLARKWQLPPTMCFAILRHHELLYCPEARSQAQPAPIALIATGLAADSLYSRLVGTECPEWTVAGEWALEELDLTPHLMNELSERVAASFDSE